MPTSPPAIRRRKRPGYVHFSAGYLHYLKQFKGTFAGELYRRWRKRGRAAVTMRALRSQLWPGVFPDRTKAGDDVRFFDLVSAGRHAARNESILPGSKWFVVKDPTDLRYGSPFSFDGAVFAFDVFVDELMPLVIAAVDYHRVSSDWPSPPRPTPSNAFVAAVSAWSPPVEHMFLMPESFSGFWPWVIGVPFTDAFMRCRPAAHESLDSYFEDLRDEFKRSLAVALRMQGISRHRRSREFKPESVAPEWLRLTHDFCAGPFQLSVAPEFTVDELLTFVLRVYRSRNARDLRVLGEIADWVLFRLRRKPDVGPLCAREEVFKEYADLALVLLLPAVREMEMKVRAGGGAGVFADNAGLRRAMLRKPHALIRGLDLTKLMTALAASPSRRFVPDNLLRLRPTKILLDAIDADFGHKRERASAPRARALREDDESDGDSDASGETRCAGFLTRSELADRLDCSPQTLRNLEKAGKLQFSFGRSDDHDDCRDYAVIPDTPEALARARALVRGGSSRKATVEEFARQHGKSGRTVRRELKRLKTTWAVAKRSLSVLRQLEKKFPRKRVLASGDD